MQSFSLGIISEDSFHTSGHTVNKCSPPFPSTGAVIRGATRNAERAEMGGMMHCGGEAQIAAQGTASPACGSRGMSCGFAVLHAFGASELEKFGPCA